MFYFLTSCGSQKELSPLCVQTNQPAGRSMIMHESKQYLCSKATNARLSQKRCKLMIFTGQKSHACNHCDI